jgi:hypothetical protein
METWDSATRHASPDAWNQPSGSAGGSSITHFLNLLASMNMTEP